MDELESFELLRGLQPDVIDFIAARIQEVSVPVGGHIVKEGDHAYRFFVIYEGTAVVSHRDRVVAELGPSSVFGEMALMEDLRRNADVIAATPMKLGALMSWDFRDAAQRYPEFERRVDELVAARSLGLG